MRHLGNVGIVCMKSGKRKLSSIKKNGELYQIDVRIDGFKL